ncbi:hypothetical protein KZ368_04155 [Glaesserella parasuis]|uniref:hypothetical protein n=1 Tax=Glaesserella parasuis TaxID=738 RepID=UPI00193C0436|nr:hypothetical protein [Glaesserella parasuis]MCT8517302.1 hypothetical protein [Glaesserella parasuis]MCT8543961.1 hypothetical protein [Glaesserella parasuis]MCT8550040.1 hypothetical protein [Glaesserella parasuis]MCT8572376.1 hypothetical protein [Glaesserella parasuis]MCT8664029.1 hypothetical protein [Glaesserella parasuis]
MFDLNRPRGGFLLSPTPLLQVLSSPNTHHKRSHSIIFLQKHLPDTKKMIKKQAIKHTSQNLFSFKINQLNTFCIFYCEK